MQVSPEANGLTRDQLLDERFNIEFGTKKYANLLRKYQGDKMSAVAAWNMGETGFEKWRAAGSDFEKLPAPTQGLLQRFSLGQGQDAEGTYLSPQPGGARVPGAQSSDTWRGGVPPSSLVGAGAPMLNIKGVFDPLHIDLTLPNGERREYVTAMPQITYAGSTMGAGTAP